MEEKQNDLDNLIIKSKKPSGLKKILLAAAILLLVLILIILVTKSMIGEKKAPQSSIILPPEPVTQPHTATKEPLFERVPIEEENATAKKIDKVMDKLKEQAPAEAKKIEEPVVETETSSKKPVVKKETSIPQQSFVQKKDTAVSGKKEYFIQVGAFFRYPPDKKFLESIKKENLNYLIVEGKKGAKPYKRVLIGPYPNKSMAKKDLDRIKKRINQNAYITRKK